MSGAGVEIAVEFMIDLLMLLPGRNCSEFLGGDVDGGIGETIVVMPAPVGGGNGDSLNFCSVCRNSDRVMWCVAIMSVKLVSFWSM